MQHLRLRPMRVSSGRFLFLPPGRALREKSFIFFQKGTRRA
jgi:hypothetical protein